MITECPNCQTKIGKGVVKCPKCAEFFFENSLVEGPSAIAKEAGELPPVNPLFPPLKSRTSAGEFRENGTQSEESIYQEKKSEPENMIPIADAVSLIYGKLKSKIVFWNILMVWTVILSLVSIFLVSRTSMMMTAMIERAIADRFGEKQIQQALLDVAQKEAKEIVEKSLDPAIQDFTKKMTATSSYVEQSKVKFDDKYAELAKESNLIDEKKTILKLSEESMRGYRKAYDDLVLRSERKEPEELAEMAKRELVRIENAYRITNRVEGLHVNVVDKDGKGRIDEAIPTKLLVKELRESVNWKVRARAAQLLGDRMERELPDLLLESAEQDPFLEVVKAGLESFSKITGYNESELFNVKRARVWWKQNKVNPYQKETVNL